MPFCPICKDEYEEGYTICADCGCPLVDSLPSENDSKGSGSPGIDACHAMHPAFLVSTDEVTCRLFCGMLEDEAIPYLVRDRDLLGNYLNLYMGYSCFGKEIYVDQDDLPAVQQLWNLFDTAPQLSNQSIIPNPEDSLPWYRNQRFYRRVFALIFLFILVVL